MMHHDGHNHKGCMMLILGLIVLANELYFNYSWWLVLGAVLTLKGLIHLVFKHKCESKKK